VCARNADRTLFIFGEKASLCGRCTGIYFGALLGITAIFLINLIRKTYSEKVGLIHSVWKFIAIFMALSMPAEVLSEKFFLYSGSNTIRSISGLLFSFGFIYLALPSKFKFKTGKEFLFYFTTADIGLLLLIIDSDFLQFSIIILSTLFVPLLYFLLNFMILNFFLKEKRHKFILSALLVLFELLSMKFYHGLF